PRYVEGHLEIAFRQLQRRRRGDLSKAEFHDLYAVWHDRDRGQQVINDAVRYAHFVELCNERAALFSARASLPPEHRDMLTVRLYEIGRELVEFCTPNLPATPLGEWR